MNNGQEMFMNPYDTRIFGRPWGFGRPFGFGRPWGFGRPFGYGFGFGAPFVGGLLAGAALGSAFYPPYGPYGYGYGYGYPYFW
ncbi:hypothetical protein M3182_00830 [Mesobacillus maritimus]|uniref:hypothetical protein n=1 Tax=Mesobacillus maritimus TaxID=1643336 RepID=UPI002041BB05|nr:hypothetical protein [Mesobacillus maritimus]MCM3584284.1 hypothetical protein [Mesobacillus maritimus]MCM3669299.1 hypothetical protein [Mesobacillus maritimus]